MSEYIGKRIIPRYDGAWDKDKNYEALCFVMDGSGDSYISRKDVPAGTALTNTDYWGKTGTFNAQLQGTFEKMLADNDATEAAIRADNDATEAAVRADNEQTEKYVADSVKDMAAKTEEAVALTTKNRSDLEARMGNIEARQDANVSASTDKNSDYAAEVTDARVGWDAKDYGSLGAALRGQAGQALKHAGFLYRNSGTEDLDDLEVNTVYLVSSSSGETTLANYPDYGHHGMLVTVGVRDDFIYQIFYGGMGDHIFLRYHIKAGGWHDWTDIMEGTDARFGALYSMLDIFGVGDILHRYGSISSRTVNGVTFTANEDGSVTADGTAAEEVPGFCNMLHTPHGWPEGIGTGKSFVIRMDGDAKPMLIQAFVNVSEEGESWKCIASTGSYAEVSVPEDCYGLLVRLCVDPGMSVDNATVYPSVSRKFTAEEYYRKAKEEAASDREAGLKYAGILQRTTGTEDMDSLAANTVYLVSSDTGETTLANFPDINSHGLILTAGVGGGYAYQVFLTDAANVLYVRFRYGSGKWVEWKNIADMSSVSRRIRAVRAQLAFEGVGDLLYENMAMREGADDTGLSYTLNGEGTVTVSGTNSTESASFHNLFVAVDGLPSWQRAGEEYICGIHDDTGAVSIHAYWYTAGKEWASLFPATKGRARYRVPEGACGILFRLEVPAGAEIEAAVYPYVKRVAVETTDQFRHMGYLIREKDTRDLNGIPVNTVYLISSGIGDTTLVNFPEDYSGSAMLVTAGEEGGFTYQMLITTESGRQYLRYRFGSGKWADWRNIAALSSQVDGFRGTNLGSHMLSFGNSILSGSVWQEGKYNHLSDYYNAPYGNIANAIGIPKDNVKHTVVSSTGLLYDAGDGSFLENIKGSDLSGYDVVLTHLWTADMNRYNVGTAEAAADDGTIAGGVVSLLEYMKGSNGQCQLILVGVPPVSSSIYGNGVFSTAYPNGSTIEELDAVMHALEEKYHFVYIDWQGLNLSYYFHDFSDGTNVHANNEDTYRAMGGYLGGRASAKIRF